MTLSHPRIYGKVCLVSSGQTANRIHRQPKIFFMDTVPVKYSSEQFHRGMYVSVKPELKNMSQMTIALLALDEAIGKSKNLRKMAPVRLITAGGFVAVSLFGNRDSTEDVDYILDPWIKNPTKAEEKLRIAVQDVTKQLKMETHWINDSMAVFAVGDVRRQLFEDSVRQNQILFQGKWLVLYAVEWQWAVTRKLIRLSTEPVMRDVDINDSVELIHRIVSRQASLLTRGEVKGWTNNIYTPISDTVLGLVTVNYKARYGISPFHD